MTPEEKLTLWLATEFEDLARRLLERGSTVEYLIDLVWSAAEAEAEAS